eukprot:6491-Heterococcus_DN1.PRE.1
MRRRDLAVAEGSFAGDKAFPSSDYAYQDIEEHSRKHKKALWITTVMLFIGYVGCAAAAYSGVLKITRLVVCTRRDTHCQFSAHAAYYLLLNRPRQQSPRPTQGLTTFAYTLSLVHCSWAHHRFMTDMQNALCARNGEGVCADKSVGGFLDTVNTDLGGVFDDIVVWLQGLTGLATHFDKLAEQTEDMRVLQDQQEEATTDLKTSSLACTAVFNAPAYARYSLSFAIPDVNSGNITALGTNKAYIQGLASATDAANATLDSVVAAPSSPIVRLTKQLDTEPGNEAQGDTDLRDSVTSVVKSTKDQVRDLASTVYGYQTHEVADANKMVTTRLNMAALSVAGVLLLPGLVLLLCAICAALCKSPKPCVHSSDIYNILVSHVCVLCAAVQCCSASLERSASLNTTLTCVCLLCCAGLYCFVAGLCLLLIKINGDVCTAHNELLKVNLDQTITIRGVQSAPLGIAAVQVLACKGTTEDAPSSDNNFVDIFQMGAVFDMSSELQSASDQVTQQSTPLRTIKDSVGNVTNAVLQVKAYPMNINGTYSGTAAAGNITAALADLPPAVFNRTDPGEINKFQTEYLGAADQTDFTPAVTWQWT